MSAKAVTLGKSAFPEKAGAETPTALLGTKSMRQSTLTEHNSNATCPTCGDVFDGEHGMKTHHTLAHGESIAGYDEDCAHCGETFRAASYSRTVYCSDDCQKAAKRSRESLECEYCGEIFEVLPSKAAESKYCSKQCFGKVLDDNSYVQKSCQFCGESFERYKSQLPESGEWYCSKECRDSAQDTHETVQCANCGDEVSRRRSKIESANENYCSRRCYFDSVSNTVEIACANCGQEMEMQASVAAMGDDNYCSDQCHSEGMSGQDNPQWRGGSSVRAAIKSQLKPPWTHTRDGALSDECCMCGESDRRLDVHHIIPIMCGGTNESWNLMTLCVNCHGTVEQFTKSLPEIQPILNC